MSGPDPFAALGLPARPDLTDDDVRAAWRRLAAATHPDRADGGDPDRFAAAAAAYTVLRTRSGRGEALADLASRLPRPRRPVQPSAAPARPTPAHPTAAAPVLPRSAPSPPSAPAAVVTRTGRPGLADGRLMSRVRRGRPGRLALRVLIAAGVTAVAAAVVGAQPATPAIAVGALTWLLRTARHDLGAPR